MRILISGSTGFIGTHLVNFLRKGDHDIFRLVRKPDQVGSNAILWDPIRGVEDLNALEGFDAVINLAGENIFGFWTKDKKEKIFNSRVQGTRKLCENLSELKQPPKVFLSASAVGYYGDNGEKIVTEDSPAGEDFLSHVCLEWERAAAPVQNRGIRTVFLRFGVVLSRDGGALKFMLIAFRLGLGGKLGSGNQYMSWIAIDDLCEIVDFALNHETLVGPINVSTPNPVTNLEFTKTLGKVAICPTFFSIPEGLLKRLPNDMGNELFLNSVRATPEKLIKEGYPFLYPDLELALRHLLE